MGGNESAYSSREPFSDDAPSSWKPPTLQKSLVMATRPSFDRAKITQPDFDFAHQICKFPPWGCIDELPDCQAKRQLGELVEFRNFRGGSEILAPERIQTQEFYATCGKNGILAHDLLLAAVCTFGVSQIRRGSVPADTESDTAKGGFQN